MEVIEVVTSEPTGTTMPAALAPGRWPPGVRPILDGGGHVRGLVEIPVSLAAGTGWGTVLVRSRRSRRRHRRRTVRDLEVPELQKVLSEHRIGCTCRPDGSLDLTAARGVEVHVRLDGRRSELAASTPVGRVPQGLDGPRTLALARGLLMMTRQVRWVRPVLQPDGALLFEATMPLSHLRPEAMGRAAELLVLAVLDASERSGRAASVLASSAAALDVLAKSRPAATSGPAFAALAAACSETAVR